MPLLAALAPGVLVSAFPTVAAIWDSPFLLLAFALALGVAIWAGWLARQATKRSRRLAHEMISLRDRLAEAERAYARMRAQAQDAVAREAGKAVREVDERIDRVSDEVRRIAGSGSAPPAALVRGPASPSSEPLAAALFEAGWEEVVLLGGQSEGWRMVELRRGDMLHKGRARLDASGRLEITTTPALRAFP